MRLVRHCIEIEEGSRCAFCLSAPTFWLDGHDQTRLALPTAMSCVTPLNSMYCWFHAKLRRWQGKSTWPWSPAAVIPWIVSTELKKNINNCILINGGKSSFSILSVGWLEFHFITILWRYWIVFLFYGGRLMASRRGGAVCMQSKSIPLTPKRKQLGGWWISGRNI